MADLPDRRSLILKGALDLCVLAVLTQGDVYGYELVRRLHTVGVNPVAEGSLYPLLTRLEKRGLVSSYKAASPDGPNRKYYKLTAGGRDALAVGKAEWFQSIDQISNALGSDAPSTPSSQPILERKR